MRRILQYMAAGALGGLAVTFAIYLFGLSGISQAMGVDIGGPIKIPALYAKMIWGGIWGLVFLLPFPNIATVLRGLVFSLLPSLVQLFVVFPYKEGLSMMGTELGALTWLFVLMVNAVWGLTAGILIWMAEG